MTDHVVNSDGTPFAVSFIKGVQLVGDKTYLFLLDDGSIHQGVIKTNSNAFGGSAVSTKNAVGGHHEKYEIPLRRVAGNAYRHPQYDARERAMWFEADFVAKHAGQQ